MMNIDAILDDATARQRKAIDPGASVWVAASAGSGKTKVLIERVLTLLLTGTQPHRILCLTFTKAASAEMSIRLARELADWAIAPDGGLIQTLTGLLGRVPQPTDLTRARRLFAQVLDVPGGMHIETIHAFCQSLLRRFPVEAGLPPHFQVMDSPDADEMMSEARHQVLALGVDGDAPILAEALAEITARVHETRFPALIDALAGKRGDLGHLFTRYGGLDGVIAQTRRRLGLEAHDTRQSILDHACGEAAFDGPGLRHMAQAMLGSKSVTDVKLGQAMAQWLAADPPTRGDGLDDYLAVFFTQKGLPRAKVATDVLRRAHPELDAIIEDERHRLEIVRDRLAAMETLTATAALLTLGKELLDAYARLKTHHAKLDYQDLIDRARALLGQSGISAWILYKLDGGIDHVLVDEAQDTSPEQWAILRALTEEFFSGQSARDNIQSGAQNGGRTLFVVGDYKQSIYSFQGADPDAFERSRDFFEARVVAAEKRWEPVDLRISFRSTPTLIDAVNMVFAPQSPARDGVADAHTDIDHLAARQGQSGRVEIWPPIAPKPSDPLPSWKPPVDRIRGQSPSQRLARSLAERIARMIGHDPLPSRGRPVRAGDILVLVRRRNSFVIDLIRELKARAVPVAGADRMVLSAQIAVMDLVALGSVLLTPQDDLTLAAVLKSPLIGLAEDQLFTLAWKRPGSLWDALRKAAETDRTMAGAWDRLTLWQRLGEQLSPYDFYARLLGEFGTWSRFDARLGAEAEDPLDEFLTLTLAYGRSHPPTLAGFLAWFEDAGGDSIKRDLDQGGGDAVRIMTVHGSKGLQAPIVVMPDTMQPPQAKQEPLVWLDGETADEPPLMVWPPKADGMDAASRAAHDRDKTEREREYHRLLYVAMTRAEDHLIVCGYESKRPSQNNWYFDIRAQLQPVMTPVEGEDGVTLVLESPQTAQPDRARGDDSAAQAPADHPLPPWLRRTPPPDPKPPLPLAPSRIGTEETVVISPLLQGQGQSAMERGRLIHRLFQTLPDIAHADRSASALRFLRHAAPDLDSGQMFDLVSRVTSILDDLKFRDFFQGGSIAEVPISGVLGENAIIGVLDRLVVTETEALVLDYKTNRWPPQTVEEVPAPYVQQMAAYRRALACVYPHRKIRAALLWTEAPLLMELPAGLLDDVEF